MNFKEYLEEKRKTHIANAYVKSSVPKSERANVEKSIGADFDAGVKSVKDFLLERANDDALEEGVLNHVLDGHTLESDQ